MTALNVRIDKKVRIQWAAYDMNKTSLLREEFKKKNWYFPILSQPLLTPLIHRLYQKKNNLVRNGKINWIIGPMNGPNFLLIQPPPPIPHPVPTGKVSETTLKSYHLIGLKFFW